MTAIDETRTGAIHAIRELAMQAVTMAEHGPEGAAVIEPCVTYAYLVPSLPLRDLSVFMLNDFVTVCDFLGDKTPESVAPVVGMLKALQKR